MSDPLALQRLLTWLSPSFPVGTFAWSQGLETAIAGGRVSEPAHLRDWIEGLMAHGGLRTDAIFLAHAYRAKDDATELGRLSDLLLALCAARERGEETLATGQAFVLAAKAWPSAIHVPLPSPCPYPIAVGALAAAYGIGLDQLMVGFLTAAVQAQVSVGVRAVPLGQTAGLNVIAALEPAVARLAGEAQTATLDTIGGIAYAADIAQMRHETLEPRLFRS